MLKKKLFKTVLAMATMVLIAPSQFALAATPQTLDDFFGYKWDNNSYSQPPDIDGTPGFVPFNNIFSPIKKFASGVHTTNLVAGSNVLTNSSGSQVGVEVTSNNPGKDTDGNYKAQQGSIWNTDGNELDLTKNFHAQMQLYFGANADSADGMAFVMAGTKPTTLLKGASGGRLGIWPDLTGSMASLAVAPNTAEKAMSTITKNALPNSFAVIFDTHANSEIAAIPEYDAAVFRKIALGGGAPSMKTVTANGGQSPNFNQFVAYAYPGQRNQYAWASQTGLAVTSVTKPLVAYSSNGDQTQSYAGTGTSASWNSVNPNGLGAAQLIKRGAITDGKWHLFTVDYKADGNGGGTLTYTTDLTSMNGTAVSKSITWSANDIQNYFGTNKVSWGFTGSTGTSFENGVVVFQSIPGLLDNSVTTKLMSDDSSVAKTAYVGRQYQQQYTVDYDGTNSKQSWPAGDSGHLAADLRTGNNYGFVVDTDGTVPVKFTKADGTTATVSAEPVSTSNVSVNGTSMNVASEIRLPDIGSLQQKMENNKLKCLLQLLRQRLVLRRRLLLGQ